jgi:hypothetical protein
MPKAKHDLLMEQKTIFADLVLELEKFVKK